MCEDGLEARYKDLEQEVKDAEPVKKQKTVATKNGELLKQRKRHK